MRNYAFYSKLLKSCAVYTQTFEYLSAGQFNYANPSVMCVALSSPPSSLTATRLERCVCVFIKIQDSGVAQAGANVFHSS